MKDGAFDLRSGRRIYLRDLRQYQWTYKRFSRRPKGSGERNPYEPIAP